MTDFSFSSAWQGLLQWLSQGGLDWAWWQVLLFTIAMAITAVCALPDNDFDIFIYSTNF